jgi:hypothetical protein
MSDVLPQARDNKKQVIAQPLQLMLSIENGFGSKPRNFGFEVKQLGAGNKVDAAGRPIIDSEPFTNCTETCTISCASSPCALQGRLSSAPVGSYVIFVKLARSKRRAQITVVGSIRMRVLPGVAYRIGIFGQPAEQQGHDIAPFMLGTKTVNASVQFVGVSAAVLDGALNVVPAYAFGPALQTFRLTENTNRLVTMPRAVLSKNRSLQVLQDLEGRPPSGSFEFRIDAIPALSTFTSAGKFAVNFSVLGDGKPTNVTAPKSVAKVQFSVDGGILIRSAPSRPCLLRVE